MKLTEQEREGLTESQIAWRVLHNFHPEEYLESMPETFLAEGVSGGAASYGFKITMPDGQQSFLKIEKKPEEFREDTSFPAKLSLMESLSDMGVPTAKPLRSGIGEEKEKPFNITLPNDGSLPTKIRGCIVSHQTSLVGPDISESLGTNRRTTVIKAARTLGQFHKAGKIYTSENPNHGLDAEHEFLRLQDVPTITAQFLEDIGFKGRDIGELARDINDGSVNFQALIQRNEQYISEESQSVYKVIGVNVTEQKDNNDRLGNIREMFFEQAKAFPQFNPDEFPDSLGKIIPTPPEHTQLIEQGYRIAHLEQVQQLTNAARNGSLAGYINTLAVFNENFDTMINLPRGLTHNDSHTENFMWDKSGNAAIIDPGEISSDGHLMSDLGKLLATTCVDWEKGTVDKGAIRSALAEYDSARSSETLPRLSENEVRTALIYPAAGMDLHRIADHIHHVTGAIGNFDAEHQDGQIKQRINIDRWMNRGSKFIASVYDQPLDRWLQENRIQALDALDLATTVPISQDVIDKAADLRAEVSAKPPFSLSKESMTELTEIKANLQKPSWVDKTALDNPRIGFNKRPDGSREI